MATAIEQARHELQELDRETQARLAQLNEDGFTPTAEWLSETEAMVNAVADRRDEVARLERLASSIRQPDAASVASQGNQRPPFARGDLISEQRRAELRSLGETFVNSPEFREWCAIAIVENGSGGVLRSGQMPNSKPVAITSASLLDMRANLITGGSDTSAGAFIVPAQSGIYEGLGRKPLDILDLVRRIPTGSDLVEYVEQTGRTNNAAGVPEATDVSDGSGEKPKSAVTWERRQAPVKTIAHWMAATRQAVADAPQLRGLIDTELIDGLRETVAAEIVAGTGGDGFTGILNTSGIQSQGFSTNVLDTARKARTKIRVPGRAVPTAYLMHPEDWEAIDLLQDNEARYIYGGPAALGTPRLWGLPVAESEDVPKGTAIVGDFRRAVVFDRMQATVSVSDSHADFFIRNLIAILAEFRAAFAVTLPRAFCEFATTGQ